MSTTINGRPVILILTGNLGDGHRQAAAALAEAAEKKYPGAVTRVIDVVERTHPRTHRFSQLLYLFWITKFPWLYGMLFRQTKKDTWLSRLLGSIRLIPLSKLLALLEEVQPDVVVSTFPSAAAAIAQLKREGLVTLPTVTVITDHTYHSYWIHKGTDRYIVGSAHIRRALLEWPVPERSIAVTGIPIRGAFQDRYDSREQRRSHGLDPLLPTVMIMGGGCGLIGGDWAKLLTAPELMKRPMQTVIVCGRNRKLQERLTRELQGYPHPVRISGYVDDVHRLMAAADILITKPGGLTTSEALASELPMLLYKPLPGQEYDNAEYLTGAGAAVQAKDDREFVRQLSNLLDNPRLLAGMKQAARRLAHRSSSEQAIREVFAAFRDPVERGSEDEEQDPGHLSQREYVRV